MKLFLLLFVLSMICSCAFKKSEDVPANSVERFNRNIIINPTDDLDFDGINNDDEKALGFDPLIANLPEVRIRQIKEIQTGVRVKKEFDGHSSSDFFGLKQEYINPIDSESKESLVRRKILNLQYLKVTDPTRLPDADEMAQLVDYDLFIVGRWKDKNFYPFNHSITGDGVEYVPDSGRITSVFKVELRGLKGVSFLERVFLSTNLIDSKDRVITEFRTHPLLKSNNTEERFEFTGVNELKPIDNYFLYDISLDPSQISDLLLSRNNVALKIKNFSFNRLGRTFDFSQLVAQVEEKTARVIVSVGDKTKTYQVAPGISLKNLLIRVGHNIKTDINGNIISIDDLSNSLSTPIDLQNIPFNELDKGVWSILGEAERIDDTLAPQKQYIVSYATAKDIISSQNVLTRIVNDVVIEDMPLLIEDIRIGDVYEVNFTLAELVPKQEIYYKESGCNCLYGETYRCGRDLCYREYRENTSCMSQHSRVSYTKKQIKLDSSNLPVEIQFSNSTAKPGDIVNERDGIAVFDNDHVSTFRFAVKLDHVKDDRFLKILAAKNTKSVTIPVGVLSQQMPPGGQQCYPLDGYAKDNNFNYKNSVKTNIHRQGMNR